MLLKRNQCKLAVGAYKKVSC